MAKKSVKHREPVMGVLDRRMGKPVRRRKAGPVAGSLLSRRVIRKRANMNKTTAWGAVGIVVIAMFWLASPSPEAVEREGELNIDTAKCEQVFRVHQGDPETRGKDFVCSYNHNVADKQSGICTSVVMDGKTCKEAYTYIKYPPDWDGPVYW